MAELLLINPRKRRAAKKTAKRRTRRVRRNPITVVSAPKRRVVRRRNPIGLGRIARRGRARRRNPISMNTSGIVGMLKTAAIGGAGAVAVDALMGYVAPYLPASLKQNGSAVGKVGVYDAIKMAITIAAGEGLNKVSKGYSRKLAAGALTVQMSDIIRTFVPTTMTMGYYSPGAVIQGNNRVGPLMTRVNGAGRMGAYLKSNASPLLSAYQAPGATQLLSGSGRGQTARSREGVTYR